MSKGLTSRELALHRLDLAEQELLSARNDLQRAANAVHLAKQAVRAVQA